MFQWVCGFVECKGVGGCGGKGRGMCGGVGKGGRVGSVTGKRGCTPSALVWGS